MEWESKDTTWSRKGPGWRRGATFQTAEGAREGGPPSGAVQRGPEAYVSEAMGGAVFGKEAAVNDDERLGEGQL